jgi:hypothetical protein
MKKMKILMIVVSMCIMGITFTSCGKNSVPISGNSNRAEKDGDFSFLVGRYDYKNPKIICLNSSDRAYYNPLVYYYDNEYGYQYNEYRSGDDIAGHITGEHSLCFVDVDSITNVGDKTQVFNASNQHVYINNKEYPAKYVFLSDYPESDSREHQYYDDKFSLRLKAKYNACATLVFDIPTVKEDKLKLELHGSENSRGITYNLKQEKYTWR